MSNNGKTELNEVAKAAAPAADQIAGPDLQSIAPAKKGHKVPVRHSRRAGVFIPRDYMEAFPGDHATYTLLSQLMYWRMPNDDGKSRLRVQDADGNFVIAKNAAELFEETRLTRGQIDSAKAKLKAAGILAAVSGARDAVKTTFYSFVHFAGNSRLDDYPTIDELKGIACTAATQCMPVCNASHAHMHSNTESVPQTVSKTKEHKHEFPSGHSGTTSLEQHQEQPGNSEPQNQPASLDEIVETSKKQGKKPGPKPAPENMGSGDWDSYFRLAKKYDMGALHALCLGVSDGFVKGTTMLAEIDCERLERLEYFLGCVTDLGTLEEHLEWLRGGEEVGEGYQYQHWMNVCDRMVEECGKDLHCPPRPRLDFYDKHLPKLKAFVQSVFDDEMCGPPKPAIPAAALESGQPTPPANAGACIALGAEPQALVAAPKLQNCVVPIDDDKYWPVVVAKPKNKEAVAVAA